MGSTPARSPTTTPRSSPRCVRKPLRYIAFRAPWPSGFRRWRSSSSTTTAAKPSGLWTAGDPDGPELLRRLKGLPGFGEQKAKIFLALLGKQYGVTPDGWRKAAGDYGKAGSFLSVADVVDPGSLEKVRSYKKQAKAAAKATKSAKT